MASWKGLVSALLLLAPIVSISADDDPGRKADSILSHAGPADGPGAMVAVAKDGKVLYRGAFGLADVERKKAFDGETVFDLASCSKQFTAMAILILSERGKLSLDDDVRKFLPELPENDPQRPIRVIDLLHMLTGLGDYIEAFDTFHGVTNEQVVRKVAKLDRQFPTGSKYVYSNTDYNLLGTIVQRASGVSYRAFLKREIFEPLGMARSEVLQEERQEIAGRAQGYARTKRGVKKKRDDTPGIVGDGSVFSTLDDLLKWDEALRQGKLAKPATLKIAYTSGKLDNGKRTGYACGWEVSKQGGDRWVFHTGGWSGTATYIARDVDRGWTVVVLSNDENLDVGGLGDRLMELWDGE